METKQTLQCFPSLMLPVVKEQLTRFHENKLNLQVPNIFKILGKLVASINETSNFNVLTLKSAEREFCFVCFFCWQPQLETKKRVGHLPTEISRTSKILLDRGAVFKAKLASTLYCRIP